MTMRYFRITKLLPGNPLCDERGYFSPIEALKAHLRKKRDWQNEVNEFAKVLGGKPVTSSGMGTIKLHGISFDKEPEHPELWTKPDYKAHFSQRPKAKGNRNIKGDELKQAHKELLKRWESRPEPFDTDEQWLCAGYKEVDLIFSGARMAMDLECRRIYVAAVQPPERGADYLEVTGGEYQKAEAYAREQRAEDYL